MTFQICAYYLVNVGSGWADRYLVNYEDIQVVWGLGFLQRDAL